MPNPFLTASSVRLHARLAETLSYSSRSVSANPVSACGYIYEAHFGEDLFFLPARWARTLTLGGKPALTLGRAVG